LVGFHHLVDFSMKSNLIEQHHVLDHFMNKLDIDSGSIDQTGVLGRDGDS
jgi:hypothetical protein